MQKAMIEPSSSAPDQPAEADHSVLTKAVPNRGSEKNVCVVAQAELAVRS
jgi:hypothetical protein